MDGCFSSVETDGLIIADFHRIKIIGETIFKGEDEK